MGESKDGLFSVKSAYAFLTRDRVPRPNMEALYNRVWRLVAPERVRVFLWLVSHQVIMTNMERKRRHLSDNGVCSLCKMEMKLSSMCFEIARQQQDYGRKVLCRVDSIASSAYLF